MFGGFGGGGCARPVHAEEAVGPAPARLYTRYGVSVWANFLAERYGLHRPLRSVSRALSQHGLVIAPGTLGDALRRFLPLTTGRRDLPAFVWSRSW